ncbi:MAG: sulfopyruvate decarboxylase subunit alpha [Acidobacteria bacterium]|nr:sulfopyruvate decarboxylase subunit alpha [Acidobacteriota bacterium]
MSSPSRQFLDLLERHGYDFFTGVPCSLFEGVTRILDAEPRYGYVSAVREDSALGLAAGAYLGGRQPVVLMQNSGLGVSVNALVSLHQIYDIPALLVVTWRGQGGKDAPEHLIMGDVMEPFLRLLHVPYAIFDPSTLAQDVEALTRTMRETHKPVALVVGKGRLQS